MDDSFLKGIRANNHRMISRVISKIENNFEFTDGFFDSLYATSSQALRIGLTGPPGAGKSTMTDRLIGKLVDSGKSVGVIAVDPTSPFTGGALLGDRVRMNDYIWNDSVYIRSMGSGGNLGGLARKAQEVGDVLAASGKDVIIYETVGVGQGEHDVANAVDLTVVILVPESGDEIQLMKAGLIEIADLFVINKSDRDGAGQLANHLRNILHTSLPEGKQEPQVFNTVASKGEGIDELFRGIFGYIEKQQQDDSFTRKRMQHHQQRVLSLVHDKLSRNFWTSQRREKLEEMTGNLDNIKLSPHKLAGEFLSTMTND